MSKEVRTPRYLSLVVPLKKVGDEAVHKELGDRMEKAATTASSLEAEQDSGSDPRCYDTILGDVDAQTRFKTTSKQSNDPSLSRGYTLRSGEDTLIDKKKVIITETSIRSDLHLEDAGGTNCLPTATIFEELAWMGRKQRKVTVEETQHDDSVPTHSNDPLLSGEDIMQLSELMILCTNLQKQVLDLEKEKDAQAKEIVDLKKRVQRLERKKEIKNCKVKKAKESCIKDIDKDANASLVDDTQGSSDDANMFDTNEPHGDEVVMDMPVAKPKVVTTAATTTTTTRPKARGVVVQDPSEFRTPQVSQHSITKDKGKAIMIEPEVPLKRKDQVSLDEDLARNLQAQLETELIEEERLARKQEEEANIYLIELWDNTQAMMEADFKLAQRLQTEEQGEITIEEKSRLFVELMNKRKKHFAMLRAKEKRRKPPTKAQKRNQISTYLKNMGGYKHN
ncbi:hypothetical protein Tco_1148889, partial [Tanacetum coccineum]